MAIQASLQHHPATPLLPPPHTSFPFISHSLICRAADNPKASPGLSYKHHSIAKMAPNIGVFLLESLQQPSVARLNGPQHLPRFEAHDTSRGMGCGSQIAMSSCTTASVASRARCSTEQQTIQNPVVTKAPNQAHQKENLPKLDDGGPGGGPGRGDGGGGGGGGGGGWAGGFFFWGLLMMAGFIKDKEKEKPYRHNAITKSKLKQMRQRQME